MFCVYLDLTVKIGTKPVPFKREYGLKPNDKAGFDFGGEGLIVNASFQPKIFTLFTFGRV